jgi:hypothetical protein
MRDRVGDAGEGVELVAVPDAEQVMPARPQHAPHFGRRPRAVRVEHDAELADDGVEGRVRVRQVERVCGFESHR